MFDSSTRKPIEQANITGFEFDANEVNNKLDVLIQIPEDENRTVVKIYYTRKSYDLIHEHIFCQVWRCGHHEH